MAYDINKHLEQLKADQAASEAEFFRLVEWAEKDAKVGQAMLSIAALLMLVGAGLKLAALGMH